MEFLIKAKDSAIPCLITVDEDNGRFMLRNVDTSGEVFQNKEELLRWVENEWQATIFENEEEYYQLLQILKEHS